ncbi:MAG TPA: M48 family metallopeptidase [Candidatus Ruthenibacterium merdigallinarum]|nr:M48 family metallopeptidase [Candidatus Ruthenibacterium merdigallinarum]
MPGPVRRTCACGLVYELVYKRVKNVNFRVRADGTLAVSAPRCVSAARIDEMVCARADWVRRAQAAAAQNALRAQRPAAVTKEQALALFEALSEELFPLFAQALGGRRPEIRVREMKTRWGSCTPAKGRITLNLRLAEYPRETARYVVAHEYAHFVRADHSPAFWAEVARAVPDWRAQRARLRGAP